MMRLIHVSVAVLGLLSVGHSAPVTDCESLIQPVDIKGRDELLGKWTLIAEATNIPGAKDLTKKLVESSWVKVAAGNDNDTVTVLQVEKMLGGCFTLRSNMTLVNGTISVGPPMNTSARQLTTSCPDCVVHLLQYHQEGETHAGVQLMSKRNSVTDAELEEFKKQVKCLKLPTPVILNPENGLCPEESPLNTDLTDVFQNLNPDFLKQMEHFMKGEGDMDSVLDLMSSLDRILDT